MKKNVDTSCFKKNTLIKIYKNNDKLKVTQQYWKKFNAKKK